MTPMYKTIILIVSLFISFGGYSQIMPGYSISDSLNFVVADSSTYPSVIMPDTAASPLWQLGSTHKLFFDSGSAPVRGLMTDTVNHYPAHANNWFTLKLYPLKINEIVTIWHRFQPSGHAGGLVEFSADSGVTWQNVKGDCNMDSGSIGGIFGLYTDNFYRAWDSLPGQGAAFMGSSHGTICSRFQFFNVIPLKLTTISCTYEPSANILVRFRFYSDAVTDTLSGWMIDSFSTTEAFYPGKVADVNKVNELLISPNPSHDGIFHFPELGNGTERSLEIYNQVGQLVRSTAYTQVLDLSGLPAGLFFYKVKGSGETYTGKIIYIE